MTDPNPVGNHRPRWLSWRVAVAMLAISFILAQFLALQRDERYRFHFDNTALTVVEDAHWGPRLLLCNDTSHLGADAAFP